MMDVTQADTRRPAFGARLLAQKDRGGLIGTLSRGAVSDRGFPRNGSPDDVKARLSAMHAEGDLFVALEDAEMDWLCL